MTAPVFVTSAAALADAVAGSLISVSGSEGRHAVSSLRVQPGETVHLVDGVGRRVVGDVDAVRGRDELEVRVTSVYTEPAHDLRLTVVQALAKGDRGELAVAQLTEIGVDDIVPWAAEHSVVHWRGDRAVKSSQRWADAIVAAAKQARRARFPEMHSLATTEQACERARSAALAMVLHESATQAIGDLDVPLSGEVVVVVGPEGGVSSGELERLSAAGATPVRLGPTIMRTSSAGMAAAAVLLAQTARWSARTVGE